MQHFPIDIVGPIAVDGARQKQTRDEEKIRNTERPGEYHKLSGVGAPGTEWDD